MKKMRKENGQSRKKRIVSTVLTGMVCLGTVTGCSGGSNSPQNAELPEAGDFSEHVTISAWIYTDDNTNGYLDNLNQNPAIAYLSEKFNVTFEWQIPPAGSETENFNIMLGSGEYTDVFNDLYSTDSPEVLYEDGVIQDISPYLEEYAPNYKAFLDSSEGSRRTGYTDEGEVLLVAVTANEPGLEWGGLVYRRDILESMTGGNVQFPSGADSPATVEDWDYMLGIMKEYFEASGMTDTACLIIPASGYFSTGHLLTGFGTTGTYYVDDSGNVQYGLLQEGFYNYLVKMKEWYEKGYVYKDFASRNSDLFYLPNTALTYGGAAGVWFGLNSQLGTAMSVPEYGLEMDVEALAAPLDTVNAAAALEANALLNTEIGSTVEGLVTDGWSISTSADPEVVVRWLQICDYLFTEEGMMLKTYGLTAEQAEGDPVYEELGLTDGAYWFDEEGNFVYNPILDPNSPDATVTENELRLVRMPGMENTVYARETASDIWKEADAVWVSDGYSSSLPEGVSLTVEEENTCAPLQTACDDYINSMVPKFIMGTEELTEETFGAFVEQVNSLGMDQLLKIYQEAYDRYMAK